MANYTVPCMHAFKQCRRALQLQGWHVEWALEFLFKMDTLHGCSSECEKRNACAMRILSICRGEFNFFCANAIIATQRLSMHSYSSILHRVEELRT